MNVMQAKLVLKEVMHIIMKQPNVQLLNTRVKKLKMINRQNGKADFICPFCHKKGLESYKLSSDFKSDFNLI